MKCKENHIHNIYCWIIMSVDDVKIKLRFPNHIKFINSGLYFEGLHYSVPEESLVSIIFIKNFWRWIQFFYFVRLHWTVCWCHFGGSSEQSDISTITLLIRKSLFLRKSSWLVLVAVLERLLSLNMLRKYNHFVIGVNC